MGAQKVRRLLLAAAAGALLASGAAASYYSYEGKWRGYLDWGDRSFEVFFIAGDDSAVGASYVAETSAASGYVGYGTFKSNGQPEGVGRIWDESNIRLESSYIYGFELLSGGAVCAFSVYYYIMPYGPYVTESYLKCVGSPGWELKESEFGYFRALTRTQDGQYLYCYRYYSGGYRICKMTTTGAVVGYFDPVDEPDDMAVDAAGYIYALSYDRIRKYNDSGSLIVQWYAPVRLTDITVDANNHLLALSNTNKYTYVFSDAGALLGSFTGPYENSHEWIHSGTGPDGKYYVGHRYGPIEYGYYYVDMYRFAPSPTNIVPTSLGKIKAMFN